MAFPRFTLRQLDSFLAVAELLSFTEAGTRLGLTPSAVSQLVTELENTLGFKLFDRNTRNVALSSAGKEFLNPAEGALRYIRLAETAAADVRNRASGIVRVAAPLVIASVILPFAIRDYVRERPKVIVRIRDTHLDHLVEVVASGDVDLVIGPDRAVGDDVERRELFATPWVLWCSPAHPLAEKRIVRWQDLRDQRLVAAGRDHERSVAQMHSAVPEDERITPVEVVDNISTALGITAAGLAATLSPAYIATFAKPFGLVMRHIVEPKIRRYVCLYRPSKRVISPAVQGFSEYLVTWMTNWNAKNREWNRNKCKES